MLLSYWTVGLYCEIMHCFLLHLFQKPCVGGLFVRHMSCIASSTTWNLIFCIYSKDLNMNICHIAAPLPQVSVPQPGVVQVRILFQRESALVTTTFKKQTSHRWEFKAGLHHYYNHLGCTWWNIFPWSSINVVYNDTEVALFPLLRMPGPILKSIHVHPGQTCSFQKILNQKLL